MIERLGIHEDELPLLLCPNGTVLRRPTNEEAGRCLGLTPTLDPSRLYDVAVVGAGPAGLATAVYAASEGLSVLVLDQRAVGGQAGASARIENYLGFPTGISGQALAGRAYNQAQKFGTELAIPLEAEKLDCDDRNGPLRLKLSSGDLMQARTVVIASGARYRRPDIPNLATFEGAGISYWASPIEAKLCEGEEIALVGGGNSAGQAVVFLAAKVKQLHLIIRGGSLDASMSHYLVERIAALPNVTLHVGTEVVALEGDRATGLSGAIFRDRATGRAASLRACATCSCSSAPIPTPAGCKAASSSTKRASSSPARTPPAGRRPCPSKPAARACSRSATCAADRPSGLPPPSAKGPRWWRRSMPRWASKLSSRRGTSDLGRR